MADVFLVSTGWYEDYTILDVFDSRPAAEKYLTQLGSDDHPEVSRMTVRSAGYEIPMWMGRCTKLHPLSGQVVGSVPDRTHPQPDPRMRETNSQTWTRKGVWEVYTNGDATKVPEVHAEAVAAKQAEIQGEKE